MSSRIATSSIARKPQLRAGEDHSHHGVSSEYEVVKVDRIIDTINAAQTDCINKSGFSHAAVFCWVKDRRTDLTQWGTDFGPPVCRDCFSSVVCRIACVVCPVRVRLFLPLPTFWEENPLPRCSVHGWSISHWFCASDACATCHASSLCELVRSLEGTVVICAPV